MLLPSTKNILSMTRVVLTVAHLDHDLIDHSDSNLLAMCQRCHLAYDRLEHRETRTGQREIWK